VRRPVAEAAADSQGQGGWARYAVRVGAHPWRYLLAGTAVLCILAAPVLSMQLGHVDAGADPASYTDKQAYDEIASAFGPGAQRHLHRGGGPGQGGFAAAGAGGSLGPALAAVSDVASVAPVQASPDGAVLYTTVVPRSRPQDAATGTLRDTLRDQALPRALAGTGATGYVTGLTSAQLDFRDQVGSQLPVFQWGWGSSLLGVSEKVPVESYVPMMMFAIVFGLSMDWWMPGWLDRIMPGLEAEDHAPSRVR